MATRSVQLEESARRALRSAFGKVPAQAEPVPVELPKGAAPLDGPDEVLVLVLGPQGGLVSRRTVRGRALDRRELARHLVGAEIALEELADQHATATPPLAAAEAALLDEAGFREDDGDRPGALERSRIRYELLVGQSLPLERAAKVLGVNTSRLRQRLAQRTLYGIKVGRAWKLPAFQFDPRRKKLVRGIEQVLPNLREDAHPLAVATWFTTPHEDLVAGEDDAPLTPVEWLSAGSPVDVVAELVKEV